MYVFFFCVVSLFVFYFVLLLGVCVCYTELSISTRQRPLSRSTCREEVQAEEKKTFSLKKKLRKTLAVALLHSFVYRTFPKGPVRTS